MKCKIIRFEVLCRKMHSIEGALRMSDEINAQFGFERVFNVRLTAMQILIQKLQNLASLLIVTELTATFYAELEKSSASQKEYLEKIQEKKAAEKKEIKKKEQSKQIEVRKTTVQANSKKNFWIRSKR